MKGGIKGQHSRARYNNQRASNKPLNNKDIISTNKQPIRESKKKELSTYIQYIYYAPYFLSKTARNH